MSTFMSRTSSSTSRPSSSSSVVAGNGNEDEGEVSVVFKTNASGSDARVQREVSTFPVQLMNLIDRESDDDNAVIINGEKVIEWLPTGDKFIIRDKFAMESCVLPKYCFNKCKFMSFVRKLYRWGFRQVYKDALGTMIFFHKKFSRGDTKKCLTMRSIVKKPKAATSILGASKPSKASAVQNAGDLVPTNRVLLDNRFSMIHHSRSDASMSSNIDGQFVFSATAQAGPLPMTCCRHMPQFYHLDNTSMDLQPRHQTIGSSVSSVATSLYRDQCYNATPSYPTEMMSTMSSTDKEDVVILMASSIMKQHPTLEAWQAFELAKTRIYGISTSTTRLRLGLRSIAN